MVVGSRYLIRFMFNYFGGDYFIGGGVLCCVVYQESWDVFLFPSILLNRQSVRFLWCGEGQ